MNKSLRILALSMLLGLVSCGGTPASSSSSSPSSGSSSSSQSSAASQESSASSASSASSVSSASSASSQQSEGDYLFYKLKEGETKDGLAGAPWLNPTTPGIVSKIEKPELKDDFFIASNYDYLANIKLAEGQIGDGGMIGAINKLAENFASLGSGKANKGNFAEAIQKAYQFYTSSDKAEDISSVQGLIEEIKGIANRAGLYNFLSSVRGIAFPWSFIELTRTDNGALVHDANSGWTIANSVTPFHNKDEAGMQNIIDKYSSILTYFGIAENDAKEYVRKGLEEDSELRGETTAINSSDGFQVQELSTVFPHLPVKTLFQGLGYKDTDTITFSSSNFNILAHIDLLENDSEIEAIKADLITRVCLGARFILPSAQLNQLAREFDPNTGGYSDDMLSREFFIDAVKNVYDRCYIDNFETKERKDLILNLMSQVKGEYSSLLKNVEWLGESTKNKAIEKVEAIRYDACYPDHLLSLPEFKLDDTVKCFYDVQKVYREWGYMASQPKVVNPDLWAGTITTMNAVYYPLANSFVYYEGLMATNPYSAENIEELYASVGTIIGHEISHSFDINGAKYDKDGMAENWWTEKDEQTFQQKTEKIVNNWKNILYRDNTPTWAEKMLGEIIADMGGVSVILRLAEKKNGFDYKKFFNAYSATYASVFSKEFVEQMLYSVQDEHPMNYLRVNNVLNQYPKFHETFGIVNGDRMYVAEADRLPIW